MIKKKITALLTACLIVSVSSGFTFSDSYVAMGDNTINSPTEFRQESDLSIADLVEQNAPAVVTVSVRKLINQGFLGQQYAEGVGTGFFIDSKGYIATNYHVVEGSNGQVNIILYDSTETTGRVIWTDEDNDLAIVQIDTSRTQVPGVVTIGNSDEVRVGEQVVAIGNPMSVEFAGTVTSGIISAKNRAVEVGGKQFHYLQTDAAINGGNSGGPLFNSRGQVIGINSAKIAQMEIEGISFAIPINILISKMNTEPGTQGQTNAPTTIGVSVKDVTADLAQRYNVPQGVMVMEVTPGSPAELGGIKQEDIITYFAGERITTTVQLNTIKSNFKPGDTVKVRIYRVPENKEYEGELTLESSR